MAPAKAVAQVALVLVVPNRAAQAATVSSGAQVRVPAQVLVLVHSLPRRKLAASSEVALVVAVVASEAKVASASPTRRLV